MFCFYLTISKHWELFQSTEHFWTFIGSCLRVSLTVSREVKRDLAVNICPELVLSEHVVSKCTLNILLTPFDLIVLALAGGGIFNAILWDISYDCKWRVYVDMIKLLHSYIYYHSLRALLFAILISFITSLPSGRSGIGTTGSSKKQAANSFETVDVCLF